MATHKQLMTLFTHKGLDNDARHDLIYQYTNGRTQSTKDLTDQERQTLVNRLMDEDRSDRLIQIKQKRATVLAIATRVGIHNTNDWDKFNRFMETRSAFKKPLNSHNIIELEALIRQFRSIEHHYNQSAQKTNTKAWNHANGFTQVSKN